MIEVKSHEGHLNLAYLLIGKETSSSQPGESHGLHSPWNSSKSRWHFFHLWYHLDSLSLHTGRVLKHTSSLQAVGSISRCSSSLNCPSHESQMLFLDLSYHLGGWRNNPISSHTAHPLPFYCTVSHVLFRQSSTVPEFIHLATGLTRVTKLELNELYYAQD